MYLVRRFAQIAAILAVLSVVLFYALHLMPGSAEELLITANPLVTAEDVARLRKLRGLDAPIHIRYRCWLAGADDQRCAWWPGPGILGGDLGYSRVHKIPVADVVADRVANTLWLTVPAFVIALLSSLLLGVIAARRRGQLADQVINAGAFTTLSLPVHWIGMLAIGVFAVGLRWLPAGGADDPHASSAAARAAHLVMPVSVLALFYIGRWTRHVRAAMLDVLRSDLVRAARARGLSEWQVMTRHALPNAAIPLVTVIAQSLPSLFSGALVSETVFSYPGMGVLIFESVMGDDHLVAMTAFLIFAALTLLASLLADVLYFAIDPRIRRPSSEGGRP